MSRLAVRRTKSGRRFPRVSGDEPPKILEDPDFVQFSPRERG